MFKKKIVVSSKSLVRKKVFKNLKRKLVDRYANSEDPI